MGGDWVEWKGIGWDVMSWGAMGCDQMRWDGMRLEEMGWDGMGWDEIGRDGIKSNKIESNGMNRVGAGWDWMSRWMNSRIKWIDKWMFSWRCGWINNFLIYIKSKTAISTVWLSSRPRVSKSTKIGPRNRPSPKRLLNKSMRIPLINSTEYNRESLFLSVLIPLI